MKEKKPYLVITFFNTPGALDMEDFCKKNHVPGEMIPVPDQITAGCGLAWKTDVEQQATMQKRLDAAGVMWENIQIVEL